ncbi:MAG: DUF4760 domain-containing protein [Promethearchaeota archaeon]
MTPISLTIGVIYYIMTLNNTRKNQELQLETRQAQLFTQLYSEYRSAENLRLYGKALQMTWDDYNDFQKKYGRENWEGRVPYTTLAHFYEEIGVLLEEGLIDINLVVQLIGGTFRWFYEKFEPIVLEYRVRLGYPQYYNKMEYLYNELKKIRGHQWRAGAQWDE